MRSARPVHKRKRRTSKEDNTCNGTNSEPQTLTIPSSSSDSQTKNSELEDEEPKISDISNQHTNNTSKEDKEQDVDEAEDEDKEEDEEREDMKNGNQKKKNEKMLYRFPMHRVKKLVRSEGADDVRVSQEAVFLINKASEKFLELFCEDAYACSVQDHKNYVAYKHLSSVICKERRFDFLSDFIPEKLKAEDALEERKLAGDMMTLRP